MFGVASRVYVDREPSRWPLLQQLLDAGCPIHLEVSLAQDLSADLKEEEALFLCHIVLAARQGHLCVSTKGAIVPDPYLLWSELFAENSSKLPQNFSELVFKGAKNMHFPLG